MKRLIVCCDGTWSNESVEENGVPSPSNVFKLHNALAGRDLEGNEQLRYYHPGLGAEDRGFFAWLAGGMVGAGIDRHICSAYRWLASNYAEGDRICLFGFSRGAFTVRSLAAFLGYGLLDLDGLSQKEGWRRVHRAYARGYQRTDSVRRDWADPDWAFFRGGAAMPVRFVGVWDTVGALGVPDDMEFLNMFDRPERWRFHDTNLGAHVTCGRHAMAMDEVRASFTVARWQNRTGSRHPFAHQDAVEQWFPGVHADVGGGYSDSSLSDGPLRWMIDEAAKHGLGFRAVADTVVGNAAGPLHNSYKGILGQFRSRPRNVPALVPENAALFHRSAFVRQEVSPLSSPAYHPTVLLKAGDSHEVDIHASKHWNPTGIFLEAGAQYLFSATGEWKDAREVCDWGGFRRWSLSLGSLARALSSCLGILESGFKALTGNDSHDFALSKRVESVPWFALVGAIANDGEDGDPAVKSDGSPHRHQYAGLACFEREPLQIESPGYLFAFPNDVWGLYGNNRGSIRLKVTRVA
ncbi:MAG: hypothetical protein RL318_1562 [Fibrobacterota bacterium]|jgi:uncharacterized protein (DUF2235 family)